MEENAIQQELNFEQSEIQETEDFATETDFDSSEQDEKPKQEKKQQSKERKTTIVIDGHNLDVSESMLKKFYGINENDPLTEREWKTALSAYKAHKKADINTEKYKRNDKLMYDFVELLQKNPAELLKRAGHDPRKFSEKILSEMLEEELMPEEQRRAMQLEREKHELERQLNEKKSAEEQARLDYATQQYQVKIQNDIIDALESDNSIPKTEDVIRRIGYYIMRATQQNLDIPIPRIVKLVKNDITKMNQEILDNMPDDKILEFLGDSRLKRIRKLELSKLKTKQPLQQSAYNEESKKSGTNEKNYLTKEEFREMVKRRARM